MTAVWKTISVILIASCWSVAGLGQARDVPLPAHKPGYVVMPEKRSDTAEIEVPEPRASDSDADDEPISPARGQAAIEAEPPLPDRAPPPSMRRPKRAAEKYGPPPPPESWKPQLVTDAKNECAKLLTTNDYAFEALDPLKEGVCGAPAPIRLSSIILVQEVKIRPSARVTCPLAHALRKWMIEVVQPRAKELLKDQIVSLRNVASYHCRTRYNDPTQRMSHHAFAKAIDISEFTTEKGDRITLTKDWNGEISRSKFLKEIHKGACKFFGTVLGPEANAAHKSHFHFDMAKRRFSSYCQ